MSEDLKEIIDVAEEEANNMIDIDADTDNHILKSASNPYSLSLRREDIDDEKELFKFIRATEAVIRKCPEYKIWTDYVRDTLGYYKCELTNEVHVQVKTDIHHHPISLFNICKGVISDRIYKKKSFSSLDIAVDVLELHYQMRVGFVVLIKSLHEKFHNGYLQLPMELVYGDYKYLINLYYTLLSDEDKEIIDARLGVTFKNCGYGNEYTWSKEKYSETISQ